MLSQPFHNNLIPIERASNNTEKRFEKFWDEPMKCFFDECSIQNHSVITPRSHCKALLAGIANPLNNFQLDILNAMNPIWRYLLFVKSENRIHSI
jgi:hypothetical protein